MFRRMNTVQVINAWRALESGCERGFDLPSKPLSHPAKYFCQRFADRVRKSVGNAGGEKRACLFA